MCNPPPAPEEARQGRVRGYRRKVFAVRDALRAFAVPEYRAGAWKPARSTLCGRVRYSAMVAIATLPDDLGHARAHFDGLVRCGSVWACPVCASQISAHRAAEIQKAVQQHGADRAFMLTLTLRHALGDSLDDLKKITSAFRALTRGEPWKRWVRRVGLVGFVRAFELTHGANGWHAHLHVLLFVSDSKALDEDAQFAIVERWRVMVARHVGAQFEPDSEHGALFTPCRDGRYLAKFGLEFASVITKSGRKGSRTPFQVAADIAERGDSSDVQLWRTYVKAMKGRRQLTWSRGLREKLGLEEEQTDEEIVDGEQLGETVVTEISAEAWDVVRDVPHGPVMLLEAAEAGGAAEVDRVLDLLLTQARSPRRRARVMYAQGEAP